MCPPPVSPSPSITCFFIVSHLALALALSGFLTVGLAMGGLRGWRRRGAEASAAGLPATGAATATATMAGEEKEVGRAKAVWGRRT
ncbi:hypothetical protein DFJ73DRAFT_869088 [Zopfochytrium polystomum]|nr:hypothetical protein DFJ73DRAFT_869088 [Zopfochytrium polystomum]